ncbi:MAG: acetylornithine deacetylase [Myxococcales bacterium]|nr:acetylornithine deacetylase [Myxococcales bacterium]
MAAPLPSAVDLLRTLVAEPSVSSPDPRHDQSNRRVVDHIAEWCEHLGFRVEVTPVPSSPEKANVVATLGDGPGGLVLTGHTDTVPFDAGGWRTDPFELVGDDDQLFGLGAADMKGFFGAALHAAQRFSAGQLREPLVLIGTADEESTMSGARALLAAGRPTARFAVVGEPTGLAPVHAHKGIMMESLSITGRSGHSSDPSLGASALEAMHRAIAELLRIRDELQAAHHDDAFHVPRPTLNLGRIEGGDSPNRICASCQLTFDLRLLPGMSLDGTRELLRARLGALFDPAVLTVALDGLVEGVPPHTTSPEGPLVRAIERVTGRPSRAVMFCTEAPFFAALGMETVVCGAGSIDVAHQPNEHTSRNELDAASDLYAALIHRFCVEGRDV